MNLFNVLTTGFLLLCSVLVQALPDDRQQPITIESDSAERNEQSGLTEYRGNVVIRQGSVLIDADRVTIHYRDNKVSRIVSLGTPASYQQQPQADGGMVVARGEIIEYRLSDDKINLKNNASLSRNGTLIKGERITYDLKNETWKAKGGDRASQKRIQLVIPPSTQENSATPSQQETNP
jgi:lipopolysaccharide export system protein LptA